ncbi:MAG: hypothetical protein H0X25_08720 [Acidobacteriales bacterium]|nr:hypothetical protein [Terriglobales bacterium]
MLATAQPLRAEIVYTPANVTINGGQSLLLDLNSDGITDFELDNSYVVGTLISGTHGLCAALDVGRKGHSGAVVRAGGKFGLAARLSAGPSIGGGNLFANKAVMAQAHGGLFNCYVSIGEGFWKGTGTGFLGLGFLINGETHYGWATVSFSAIMNTITATLQGYAYETVPGQSIKAGHTHAADLESEDRATPQPTLGLLAVGCSGLDLWRKEMDCIGDQP